MVISSSSIIIICNLLEMSRLQYFNPEHDLVFHKNKEGQLMSGGYQISNLLFENKVPLFAKVGGSGSDDRNSDNNITAKFIPEKFSDLFRDLAVPAGLFMMPPLYSTRKYAYEPRDDEPKNSNENDADSNSHDKSDDESDHESDHDTLHEHPTKFAPTDIFDKLLALVTPSERIKHDHKTRGRHPKISNKNKAKTRRHRNNKNF
jgi:hypothetical protein